MVVLYEFSYLDLHPNCSFCAEPLPSTPHFRWIAHSQFRQQIFWEPLATTCLSLASVLLPVMALTSLTPFSSRNILRHFSVSSCSQELFRWPMLMLYGEHCADKVNMFENMNKVFLCNFYDRFQKVWLKYLSGNGNPLQYSCLEYPMDRGAISLERVWSHGKATTNILLIGKHYIRFKLSNKIW